MIEREEDQSGQQYGGDRNIKALTGHDPRDIPNFAGKDKR
jgi:hypothetical protein